MKHSSKYGQTPVYFLFWILMIGHGPLLAQAPSPFSFSLDGNIRYRFESWDNMNTRYYGSDPGLGDPNDNILLQRIIAGTSIRTRNNITFSAHLQDSRAFGWSLSNGKDPGAFKKHPENSTDPYYIMNPQEEFFEIFDLNIRIDSFLNQFTVIAGRQKIAYDDFRTFGPGSWGNTGRWSWDAVKLAIDKSRWSGAIWYGGTKIHDPRKTYLPFTHTEYWGGGFHLHAKPFEFLQTDLYFAHKHQGSAPYIQDKSINRNWAGFRLYQSENASLKYEFSFTSEFGEEENSRLSGQGIFAMLGYQSKALPWKPCLSFRYSYASGNQSESSQNELFDPVYGAGDRYYGWMNLLKWSNLDDREIMLELYPLEKMRIELKYNWFRIPEPDGTVIHGNLTLPSGRKHLGDEIDLFAKYDYSDHWQFVTALGYFLIKEGQTTESKNPGNAFLISFQVLYRFKLNLS